MAPRRNDNDDFLSSIQRLKTKFMNRNLYSYQRQERSCKVGTGEISPLNYLYVGLGILRVSINWLPFFLVFKDSNEECGAIACRLRVGISNLMEGHFNMHIFEKDLICCPFKLDRCCLEWEDEAGGIVLSLLMVQSKEVKFLWDSLISPNFL